MATTKSMIMLLVSILSRSTMAAYTMSQDYSGSSFFSGFQLFTGADPTNGDVQYVDQATATANGLASIMMGGESNGTVYLGSDSTNVAPNGRQSIRISSIQSFNHGLFLFDFQHMPEGCGTWPAAWLLGSGTWPANGEIDILEGVNKQIGNQVTLHTNAGCSLDSNNFSGQAATTKCDINASGQSKNQGCGITDNTNVASFGAGFNAANGGVYATEWSTQGISVYFFSRNAIPQDITSGSPDPTTWGTPMASFPGGSSCDIDSHFKDMSIILDNTFCGDWAGATWNTSTCASMASSCNDYVSNNPSAFKDAYWLINSIKVYEEQGSSKMVKRRGGATLPA